MRECLAAIDGAMAVGDPATEAQARFILDWAYVSLGQADRAVHSERALELYTELGDLPGQARVLNNLGGFAYFDGRWDEAIELYERSRELRARTGNVVDAAVGLYNIGEVLIDQGHLDKAEECMVEVDRVWRASDDRIGIGIAQMQLARGSRRRGASSTPRSPASRRPAGILEEMRAEAEVVEVDLRTAECLLAAGDHRGAGRVVDEALRRDEALAGVVDHAPLLRVLAGALLEGGDVELAETTIQASLEEARDRDASFEIARALVVLAEIERAYAAAATPPAITSPRPGERFAALGVVEVPLVAAR